MSSPNLARSARKIGELPSDGGRTVDTIAGAVLRLFVKLNETEAAQARLGRRLAAPEGPQSAAEIPSAASASHPAARPQRRRGRPPGRPTKRRRNGHDIINETRS